MATARKHPLAEYFRQILIISWKNLLLLSSSKAGLVCEILFSTLFTLIFFVLAYYSTPSYRREMTYSALDIIDLLSPQSTQFYYYYPNNLFIQSVAKKSLKTMNQAYPGIKLNLTASRVDNAELLNKTELASLFALVSFPASYDSNSSLPDAVQYSIYTGEANRVDSYKTDETFFPKSQYMFENSPEYFCQQSDYWYDNKYKLFNAIKYSVDLALLNQISSVDLNPSNMKLQEFNCPPYTDDLLKSSFAFFPPVLVSLAFLVTFLLTASSIIEEKSTKMKEYLRLIGVKPTVIWICWMARSFTIYVLLSLIITIISTLRFSVNNPNIPEKSLFLNTSWFVIFATCIVYSIQITSLSLLVGQIFNKPFLAKTISIIFWIMTLIDFSGSSSGWKYFFTIFPNSALSYAFKVVFQYERSCGIMTMMLFWSAFYLALSWYLERVFPGEYGVKLPFYFPFMKSYWIEKSTPSYFSTNTGYEVKHNSEDQSAFEKDPSDLYASVKIKNLTKKFRTGFEEKTAVDNISLNFYENQITGFLGYNGAGKTTTTFILCGLYPPTSGSVEIMDYNIGLHMHRARGFIGFCPQNNILYDDLTVEHHLKLVASVKGMNARQIDSEVKRIGAYVGLANDMKKRAKQLSGGMKRRLSVGMAFVGDSKVIILDEPTSGLDPFNRRSLWEMIRNYKTGRTIILTTHYMEEADALSDRIAVMNHGRVKCCGSPLFLKNKFGSGYRLTLTKGGDFKLDELIDLVREVTGEEPNIQSNVARELCLSVPNNMNEKMPTLLLRIEEEKYRIGIVNYGISSSTVEEVFLSVGDEHLNHETNKENDSDLINNLNNVFNVAMIKNNGFKLYAQQVKSLLIKRAIIFAHRYIIAFAALFLPLIVQAVLTKMIPSTSSTIANIYNNFINRKNIPSYKMDLFNYGAQSVPYTLSNDTNSVTLRPILDKFFENEIKNSNKPSGMVRFVNTGNVSVSDYVYSKRIDNLENLVSDYFLGMRFGLTANGVLTGVAYYSQFVYHSIATALSQLDSFLLAYHTNNPNRSIVTTNAPITILDNATSSVNISTLNILECIEVIPFSFIDFIDAIVIAFMISVCTIHSTREKRNGSKFLQLLSGAHYSVYWLANYIFDMTVFIFNILTLVVVLQLVSIGLDDTSNDVYILASDGLTLFYLFLYMLLASFSWATLSYIWSFFFKRDVIAFITIYLLLGFATFVDMVLVLVRYFSAVTMNQGLSSGLNIARTVLAIVFPNVALKRTIFNLKLRNTNSCVELLNILFGAKMSTNSGPFDFDEPGIGKFVLFVFIFSLGGVLILYLLENQIGSYLLGLARDRLFTRNYVQNVQYKEHHKEADVQSESQRIINSNVDIKASEEPLLLKNVCKVFKKSGRPFHAVNDLTFGVWPTECFGLLGLNGAGKTTTMQILTGELNPTKGVAFVNGHNIVTERLKATRSLGYCPQFDNLPEYLSVRQSLQLFANIRGIKPESVNKNVDNFVTAFNLDEHRNKLVQNLSGGNKRKTSSAIAFIGQPKTIILDEPTSGMDPSARRYFWNVIKYARDTGMTVLLTTHSMDECEALCTKLGIMVNGQFECFGNIQHLKAKYGKGYTLVVKCRVESDGSEISAQKNAFTVRNVINFISGNLPNAVLKDTQQQTLFYQIELNEQEAASSRSVTANIAQIFSLIERNKDLLNIETYLLSQTTLEQIFISFARKQSGGLDNPIPSEFTHQTPQVVTVHPTQSLYTNKAFSVTEETTFSV